jgi:hypothetical protein
MRIISLILILIFMTASSLPGQIITGNAAADLSESRVSSAWLARAPSRDSSQPAQAESGVPSVSASPEGLLNPDGTLDRSIRFQRTLDIQRGPVLEPVSPSTTNLIPNWNRMNNQVLNNYVNSLAVIGDVQYLGSEFTQTGDGSFTNLGCLARLRITHRIYLPIAKK